MPNETRPYGYLGDYQAVGQLLVRQLLSGDGVGAVFVPTNPNGSQGGPKYQLAIAVDTGVVYQNTNGGTAWSVWSPTAGTVMNVAIAGSAINSPVNISSVGDLDWFAPTAATRVEAYPFGTIQARNPGPLLISESFEWVAAGNVSGILQTGNGTMTKTVGANGTIATGGLSASPAVVYYNNPSGGASAWGFSFRTKCGPTASYLKLYLGISYINVQVTLIADDGTTGTTTFTGSAADIERVIAFTMLSGVPQGVTCHVRVTGTYAPAANQLLLVPLIAVGSTLNV